MSSPQEKKRKKKIIKQALEVLNKQIDTTAGKDSKTDIFTSQKILLKEGLEKALEEDKKSKGKRSSPYKEKLLKKEFNTQTDLAKDVLQELEYNKTARKFIRKLKDFQKTNQMTSSAKAFILNQYKELSKTKSLKIPRQVAKRDVEDLIEKFERDSLGISKKRKKKLEIVPEKQNVVKKILKDEKIFKKAINNAYQNNQQIRRIDFNYYNETGLIRQTKGIIPIEKELDNLGKKEFNDLILFLNERDRLANKIRSIFDPEQRIAISLKTEQVLNEIKKEEWEISNVVLETIRRDAKRQIKNEGSGFQVIDGLGRIIADSSGNIKVFKTLEDAKRFTNNWDQEIMGRDTSKRHDIVERKTNQVVFEAFERDRFQTFVEQDIQRCLTDATKRLENAEEQIRIEAERTGKNFADISLNPADNQKAMQKEYTDALQELFVCRDQSNEPELREQFEQNERLRMEQDKNAKLKKEIEKIAKQKLKQKKRVSKNPQKLTINQRFFKEEIIDSSLCKAGTYKRTVTKQDGVEILQCKLKDCVDKEGSSGCDRVDQSKLFDKRFFKRNKQTQKIERRMK